MKLFSQFEVLIFAFVSIYLAVADADGVTCQISGQWVQRFDGVVGKLNPTTSQSSYILLTADPIDQEVISVFGKNLGTQNIELKVILPGTKIIIEGMQVNVNGGKVQLPHTVGSLAKIYKSNGGIHVETPGLSIDFNGAEIVFYGDSNYQQETFGLCGETAGEKIPGF